MRSFLSSFLVLSLLGAFACGDGGPAEEGIDDTMTPLCEYPTFTGQLGPGETFPNLSYSGVLDVDGSTLDFTLEEFFCDPVFDVYDSLIVVVSAGWCSACPDYIARMNAQALDLAAAGALLAYIEVETSSFEDATSEDAAEFIDECVSPDEFVAGLRIGEADRTSEVGIRNAVRQFPSAYFIRRRDMQIVADQAASPFTLDFRGLAADPEQEWVPFTPPFMAQCGPADEEPSEPNDTFETATPLGPEAEIEGGVCADGPDFYFVDRPGEWRFDLYQRLFPPMEGVDSRALDLDIRLWSTDGERIGGSNQFANNDFVRWAGPAYVEVYGEGGRSGTYRVRVQDL
ncbi:MAG: hypothetical protein AAGH15_28190 [Myxococcota bacterium]